ncbi:MAG TPA: hypothetical protein DD738_04675 [Ruminiclostridium sp.]|nr:hypothetical protein [Ruminiclostridium sp.]
MAGTTIFAYRTIQFVPGQSGPASSFRENSLPGIVGIKLEVTFYQDHSGASSIGSGPATAFPP